MNTLTDIFLASEFSTILLVSFCLSAPLSLIAIAVSRYGFRKNPHQRARILGVAIVGIIVLPILAVAIKRIPQTFHRTNTIAVLSNPPETASVLQQAATPAISIQPAAAVIGRSAGTAVPALLVIWMIGTTILALRLIIARIRLARQLRDIEQVTDPIAVRAAAKAFTRIGLQKQPPVLVSTRITSPFVMGLLRPAVILPSRLSELLTEKQLEDVLTHEAAHLRRRDLLIGFGSMILSTTLWICPWIHLLNRKWAQSREEACDAWALRYRASTEYANTLIAVGQLAVNKPRAYGHMAMANHYLQDRVEHMLTSPSTNQIPKGISSMKLLPLAIAAIVAVGPIVSIADDLRATTQSAINVSPTNTTPATAVNKSPNTPLQIQVESKFIEIDIENNTRKKSASKLLKGIASGTIIMDQEKSASMIRQLSQEKRTDILSAPKVTTLSGEQATIRIGQEIPIVQPVGEIKFIDTGLTVEVTATASAVSQPINLSLKSTIAKLSGSNSYENNGQKFERPIISQRSIETELVILNGETVLIGSLPIEADKPNRTTLIFVTATIINDNGTPSNK